MGLTSGERAALRWLTAVAALGASVQLYRHWRHGGDATPLAAEALSRQLVAVDSAQRDARHARSAGAGSRTAPGRRRARSRNSASPANSPQNDVTPATERVARPDARDKRRQLPTLGPVDVDLADSTTLERLPRIGPALAARIVSDRTAKGPFGTLAGLERVRGIGPKLAQLLSPLVTFSGIPRPTTVQR
jgi:DNA uptake protein ComE-like DNA-binding protein